MLEDESVTSFLGRYTQIRDNLGAIGEVVNPNYLVGIAMNSFTKPWGPFIRGIVSREVMPTWERMLDKFIQEDISLAVEASGQQHQQKQPVSSVEELALWKRERIRPVLEVPPQGGERRNSSGQKRDMSTVRCFTCGDMGHYAGHVPRRRRSSRMCQ
jgi:hypothetical protein